MRLYSYPLVTIDEDRNQLPTAFATATFATVRDRFFIVTPEHALKDKNNKPVLLNIDGKLVSLAQKKVHKAAKFDLAVIELSNDEIDMFLPHTVFITKELLSYIDESFLCVLEGYPAHKNKQETKLKPIDNNISHIWLYNKQENYFPDEQYNEQVNFAYVYDEKKLFDEALNKTQPRKLSGMSGGMFKLIHPEIGALPYGIFLARNKRKKALIGLKYKFIIDWIEYNLDYIL